MTENDHIKTERLLIRRVRAGDWRAIQAVWTDAARSVYAQYDRPNDLRDNAVRARIGKWASFGESREHMFFAVCLSDELIGYAALHRHGDACELGYCFRSDHHRKGYAKESISAILGTLKQEGVTCVSAGTALDNVPSVRLLNSLGFRQTGTEKVSFYKGGNGEDIVFDGGTESGPPLCVFGDGHSERLCGRAEDERQKPSCAGKGGLYAGRRERGICLLPDRQEAERRRGNRQRGFRGTLRTVRGPVHGGCITAFPPEGMRNRFFRRPFPKPCRGRRGPY